MTRILRGPAARRRVVPATVWSAEEQAAAIRSRAHQLATAELAEIEARARTEREKLATELALARREAEERGLAEGRRHGEAQGLRKVLDAFGAAAGGPGSSEALVSVVVDAASALIGETLTADPDRMAAMVLRTMDRVRRARHVRVEVHPEDLASIEPAVAARGATVSPNASLARGDCIVRSNLGTVDGRLTTRLSILRDALASGERPAAATGE